MKQLQRGLFKTLKSCLEREMKIKLKNKKNKTHGEAAQLGCERVKGDKIKFKKRRFQSFPKILRGGAGNEIWVEIS